MRAVMNDRNNAGIKLDAAYADPQPQDGECLVRVLQAGICATDLHLIDGYMQFDGILGHEFVGVVESGTPQWRGKRVAAEINCVCGRCPMCQSGLSNHCTHRTVLGIAGRDGCFADYLVVPERNLHEVPESVSDEQAVFIEPTASACQVLAQCPIDARAKVAVVGSGRLGLLVAQVLRPTGCRLQVIGRNLGKLQHAEKKGVQAIHVDELAAAADRDVVVDCSGSPSGFEIAMALVRPRGTIVLKSTHTGAGAPNMAPIVVNEVTVIGSRCGPFGEAINALTREAVEVRSMISRTFPLDDAAAAFAAARDRKNLKILLRVSRS